MKKDVDKVVRPRTTFTRWPCMFKHPMIREQINPRLAKQFAKVPYGAFQRVWRSEHCSQLDPYGTGACPYRREDCALAYYQTAVRVLTESTTSPVGLFRAVARKYGAVRADTKPLAREILRTNGQSAGQGDAGAPSGDLDEGPRVHRARMEPISSLLRKKDG